MHMSQVHDQGMAQKLLLLLECFGSSYCSLQRCRNVACTKMYLTGSIFYTASMSNFLESMDRRVGHRLGVGIRNNNS